MFIEHGLSEQKRTGYQLSGVNFTVWYSEDPSESGTTDRRIHSCKGQKGSIFEIKWNKIYYLAGFNASHRRVVIDD